MEYSKKKKFQFLLISPNSLDVFLSQLYAYFFKLLTSTRIAIVTRGFSRARAHLGAALVHFSLGLNMNHPEFYIIFYKLGYFYGLVTIGYLKSYENLQMDLNQCICFLNQISICQCFTDILSFIQYTPLRTVISTYPNIKKTMKIAKSKVSIFKVPGSVPDREVKSPRLVSRRWTCRFFTFHGALDVQV